MEARERRGWSSDGGREEKQESFVSQPINRKGTSSGKRKTRATGKFGVTDYQQNRKVIRKEEEKSNMACIMAEISSETEQEDHPGRGREEK